MSNKELKIEIQNLLQKQTNDRVLQEVLGLLHNASLNSHATESNWPDSLKQSIERGKKDIETGNVVPLEEFKKNRNSWRSE